MQINPAVKEQGQSLQSSHHDVLEVEMPRRPEGPLTLVVQSLHVLATFKPASVDPVHAELLEIAPNSSYWTPVRRDENRFAVDTIAPLKSTTGYATVMRSLASVVLSEITALKFIDDAPGMTVEARPLVVQIASAFASDPIVPGRKIVDVLNKYDPGV